MRGRAILAIQPHPLANDSAILSRFHQTAVNPDDTRQVAEVDFKIAGRWSLKEPNTKSGSGVGGCYAFPVAQVL